MFRVPDWLQGGIGSNEPPLSGRRRSTPLCETRRASRPGHAERPFADAVKRPGFRPDRPRTSDSQPHVGMGTWPKPRILPTGLNLGRTDIRPWSRAGHDTESARPCRRNEGSGQDARVDRRSGLGDPPAADRPSWRMASVCLTTLFLLMTIPVPEANAAAPEIERWERHDPDVDDLPAYDRTSVTWRLLFNQRVRNVSSPDFEVSSCENCQISVSVDEDDEKAYLVSIQGGKFADLNHDVRLSIKSNHNIENLQGERMTERDGQVVHEPVYTIRNKPYVYKIVRHDPTSYHTNSDTLVVRYQFSERMRNVDTSDFYIDGTSADITSVTTTDDKNYLVTASGGNLADMNGRVRIYLERDQDLRDHSGHRIVTRGPQHGDDRSYIMDNVSPKWRWQRRYDPSQRTTTSDSVTFHTTFDEAVRIRVSDFKMYGQKFANGISGPVLAETASSVQVVDADNQDEWLVTFTDYQIDSFAAIYAEPSAIRDLAGNVADGVLHTNNNAIFEQYYDIDNIHPVPVFRRLADFMSERSTTIGIDWSEDVSDFTIQDISVSGGTLSDFKTVERGRKYTVVWSHSVEGAHTISVRGGGAEDNFQNGSVETSRTAEYDWTPPRVKSIRRQDPGDRDTNADSLTWRIEFTEPIERIDRHDFSVSGASVVKALSVVEDSERKEFDLTVSGGNLSNRNGVVTMNLDMESGTITIRDRALNRITNGTPTATNDNDYLVDNIAPSVVISGVPATAAAGVPFTATLRFSERMVGFELADISVTGARLSAFTPVRAGEEWTVSMTPNANYRLAVGSGVATDAAGNGNLENDGNGSHGIVSAPGAGVTVSPASLTLAEGGTGGNFTVVLDAVPLDTVTVALGSDNADVRLDPASLTFTTGNWSAAQTVTATAAEDKDAAQDTATLTANPAGGGYDTAADATVAVTVIDNDAAGAGLTVEPASLTVVEGATETFTVVLDAVPLDTVTVALGSDNAEVTLDAASLTFTTGNWSEAQTVTATAAEDDDAAPDSATLTANPSGGGYDAVDDATVPVTVTDNDAAGAGVTVTPTRLTVVEGAAKSFAVVLDAVPLDTVTVALGSDNAEVTLDATSLTFTRSDWSEAQTVTATAAEDADAVPDTATVTANPSGGGYDAVEDATVAVTVTDNDAAGAGLTVEPASLTVVEGAAETFTVVLDAVPLDTVTVALGSDNADVTLDPTSLAFTTGNWSEAQTVTATAAEDADAAPDTATLTANASGGGYDAVEDATVAVTVSDNDAPGAGISVTPTSLTVVEGAAEAFTVVLDAVPLDTVTVALGSDNAEVTLDAASLTFTTGNWSAAQTVTATAAEDADAAPDTATLTANPSGGGYDAVEDATVAVTVTDNDAAGAGLTVEPASLTVVEGAAESFTVVLDAVPLDTVTVALGSDNAEVTLDATSLTFTTGNWSAAQTVTATAAEDDDAAPDSATLTANPSGGGYDAVEDATVAVTVTDNDAAGAGLTVEPASLTVVEGAAETFTVVLDAVPLDTVTVALGSDNADVTLDPDSLTFTTGNWSAAQTVTATAAEDDDPVPDTATLTANPSGGGYDAVDDATVAVSVTDNDAAGAGVTVWPESLTFVEGSKETFMVALDVEPLGTVTVELSSDNSEVTLDPTALTFTKLDWTAAQMVTATAAENFDAREDGDETLYTATVTANPVGGGYDAVDDSEVEVTVTDVGELEKHRQVTQPALVDVALSSLWGMSEAMSARFGGVDCGPAVRLGGADVTPDGYGTAGRRTRRDERKLESDEALDKSAFRWSTWCKEPEDRRGRWTFWARGDVSHYRGDPVRGRYEGSLRSAWFGADKHLRDDVVAGVAVSRGQGRTSIGLADDTTSKMKVGLTVGWPYLRVETEGGGSLQLFLGAGRGTVEYRPSDREAEKSDLDVLMASASGRTPSWRGDRVALRGRAEIEAATLEAESPAGTVEGGVKAEAWRFRAGLEADGSPFRLDASDWALATQGKVTVAHDEGDGLAGTGLELSAAARLVAPNPRFGLSVSGRWLALHSGGRHRNWGGGVEAVWQADSEGRGLSLSVTPTWGLREGGLTQGDGTPPDADVFATWAERVDDDDAALASRLGYGLALSGDRLLTPYVETAFGSREDSRRVTAGVEFEWRPSLVSALVGERTWASGRESEFRIGFVLRLRF